MELLYFIARSSRFGQYLSLNGFSWEDKETGEMLDFILEAFICSLDTVARAVVQNRMAHNAYYGYSWCFMFGRYCGDVRDF